MAVSQIFLLSCLVIIPTYCLDNGLARTPPMGWLSWERFECNTDCMSEPDSCIGERLLMQMADVMSSEGYKDVGYEYITVDDCWPATKRDSQGKLQGDPARFPSGIKKLAQYIHSKGLKLGLYEDVGRHTCAGFPGTIGHYEEDAKTLADWGVDMLKFDGCNADGSQYAIGYPQMGKYLNQTGRPILYSCEWALYDRAVGIKPNYTAVAETCNTFRVYGDIYNSAQSIFTILGWYGDDTGNFSKVAGPGNWNDADMLTLGNYGLSHDQERVQLGMWSMISSPLLMSVDLRTINAKSKALLQNRRVLAISQDPLGKQGKRILKLYNGNVEVWTKPVAPEGSMALAILNKYEDAYPVVTKLTLKYIALTNPGGYNVTEVFDGQPLGHYKPSDILESRTNPTGIQLYRLTAMKQLKFRPRKPSNYFKRKMVSPTHSGPVPIIQPRCLHMDCRILCCRPLILNYPEHGGTTKSTTIGPHGPVYTFNKTTKGNHKNNHMHNEVLKPPYVKQYGGSNDTPKVIVDQPRDRMSDPFKGRKRRSVASLQEKADLILFELNMTLDTSYCHNNQCRAGVGSNFTYDIPVSQYFGLMSAVLTFDLAESLNVSICYFYPITKCGENNKNPNVMHFPHGWSLPIGYYEESFYIFRVAKANLTKETVCGFNNTNMGTLFSEYWLKFHRIHDNSCPEVPQNT